MPIEESVMQIAKIFWNGRSQAVRLPKEFRFNEDEVHVSRENGRVILTPKPKMTWKEFFSKHAACPDFKLERPDNVAPQKRDLF
jgi:antitoxin VapB